MAGIEFTIEQAKGGIPVKPVIFACLSTLNVALPQGQPPAPAAGADLNRLVYADFEKMENNRPVSARGGLIQLFAYEESAVHKSTFKGLDGANPPAPELVASRRTTRTSR